ncbi:hypothetical protein [Butyricicoccus pullicaecorum]|nr:hypothetical protein [Butyricicoccus pullicaecorum]
MDYCTNNVIQQYNNTKEDYREDNDAGKKTIWGMQWLPAQIICADYDDDGPFGGISAGWHGYSGLVSSDWPVCCAAFYVFCAEGIFYTHSRKNYMLRLYIGWVLMNLCNNWISQKFAQPSGIIILNGMFGTMFLVVLTVTSVELIRAGQKERAVRKIGMGLAGLFYFVASFAVQCGAYIAMTGMFDAQTGEITNRMFPVVQRGVQIMMIFVPNLMNVEGGFLFVLLGVAFYYLRRWRIAQVAALGVLCLIQWLALPQYWLTDLFIFLAAIPICLYNGQAGSNRHKFLFYWYYPAHVYLIYIVGYLLMTRWGVAY